MEIKSLIVHNININGAKPEYSNDVISFDSLQEKEKVVFKDFFIKHIDNQRVNNKTKPATFKKSDEVENDTYNKLKSFYNINNYEKTLKLSKELTYNLYNTMKGVSQSDGIFLFVFYNSREGEQYLCLMKMDPEAGIQYNRESHTLIIVKDMLPNSNRRLHKVAYFNLDDIEKENYVFQVLDKQQSDDNVSNFFIEKFLESEMEYNDKKTSSIFADSEESLFEVIENKDEVDYKQLDKIMKEYKALFNRERPIQIVDEVTNILGSQIKNDDLIQGIVTEWTEGLVRNHGDKLYFDFMPHPDKRFNRIFKDENDRITLQYDAYLEAKEAVKFNYEEEGYINIKLDKAYVIGFDKR